MGTRAYGKGGKWQPQSFGIAEVARISCIAPIVQIGRLPDCIEKETMELAKRAMVEVLRWKFPGSPAKHKLKPAHWPYEHIRPGPLYVSVTLPRH